MNNSEYYGKENPFEPIKIIDYYNLDFFIRKCDKICIESREETWRRCVKRLEESL